MKSRSTTPRAFKLKSAQGNIGALVRTEIEDLATKVAFIQMVNAKNKVRIRALKSEADKLQEEVDKNEREHAELLRKVDAAAKLP